MNDRRGTRRCLISTHIYFRDEFSHWRRDGTDNPIVTSLVLVSLQDSFRHLVEFRLTGLISTRRRYDQFLSRTVRDYDVLVYPRTEVSVTEDWSVLDLRRTKVSSGYVGLSSVYTENVDYGRWLFLTPDKWPRIISYGVCDEYGYKMWCQVENFPHNKSHSFIQLDLRNSTSLSFGWV